VDTAVPLLPLTLDGQRPPLRRAPPSIGEHSGALLHELGYRDGEIEALREAGVITLHDTGSSSAGG
jgi:crotonobetainyl-CoA:carnitine CoA-transferase CaiB-like acyl-CoA transferase